MPQTTLFVILKGFQTCKGWENVGMEASITC
ncbi:unnamed protein product, partial [Vitis vinifera]